jgi:N-acetylglutamate synthase-like GNAT family acetyltransferase
MNIQLRIANKYDAPAITELTHQLGYPVTVEQTLKNLECLLNDESGKIIVAVEDEEVIGWIHVYRAVRLESNPFCELGGLVIADKKRNRGIGKLLVDAAREWCIAQKTPWLKVRSNTKRDDAHRFYLNAGFAEIKVQKVFLLAIS